MATRLFQGKVNSDCWVTLRAEGTAPLPPLPDPPTPLPLVRSGPSALEINSRCYDFGPTELEIWAGDPGPPTSGWEMVFDGELEVRADGVSVGTAFYPVYRIDQPAGKWRLRADVTRDSNDYVSGVRFVFPQGRDLKGTGLRA